MYNIGGGGGGSGYVGGCIQNPLTFTESGNSGVNMDRTRAVGASDVSYVLGSNVGTGGNGGNTSEVPPGPGGPGMIVIITKLCPAGKYSSYGYESCFDILEGTIYVFSICRIVISKKLRPSDFMKAVNANSKS